MKRQSSLCLAISVMSLSIGSALAAGPVSSPASAAGPSSPNKPTVDAGALARATAKFEHALAIANQFKAQAAADGISGDNWRFEMIGNMMKGSEANFAAVSYARSLTDAMGASLQVAQAGNDAASSSASAAGSSSASAAGSVSGPNVVVAESLGQPATDLVYVPITPCRILDTRAGGAAVPANTARTYYFSASNVGTGSCSVLGQIPGTTAAAAFAANVTVVEAGLSGFPAGSYLQIYPQGGSTTTSFMNFGPGDILANAGIISLNQSNGQFTVISNAPTQTIVDTYGVFIAPQPTALDCTTTTASGTVPVNTTTYFGVTIPACTTGYTKTGSYCYGPAAYTNGYVVETGPNACEFRNFSGSVTYVGTAVAQCCRVPGR